VTQEASARHKAWSLNIQALTLPLEEGHACVATLSSLQPSPA